MSDEPTTYETFKREHPDLIAKAKAELVVEEEIARLRETVTRCHDLLELAYGAIDPEQEPKLLTRIGEELDGPCDCPSPTQWQEMEAKLEAAQEDRDTVAAIKQLATRPGGVLVVGRAYPEGTVFEVEHCNSSRLWAVCDAVIKRGRGNEPTW